MRVRGADRLAGETTRDNVNTRTQGRGWRRKPNLYRPAVWTHARSGGRGYVGCEDTERRQVDAGSRTGATHTIEMSPELVSPSRAEPTTTLDRYGGNLLPASRNKGATIILLSAAQRAQY